MPWLNGGRVRDVSSGEFPATSIHGRRGQSVVLLLAGVHIPIWNGSLRQETAMVAFTNGHLHHEMAIKRRLGIICGTYKCQVKYRSATY